MNKKEKTVKHKTLHDAKWLRLISVCDMATNDSKWTYVTRVPEGHPKNSFCADAAVIVPIHIDKWGNKTLVINKEYRYPIQDFEWGFPAGLIDKGEEPLDAAIRELKEETGYNVITTYRVSPPVISSAGLSDESTSMVYVLCNGEDGNQQLEETEEIETKRYTIEELRELMKDSNVVWSCKAWPIIDIIVRTGSFDCIEG